jgi:ATP-binding cassette subfamily B multidrug efflux pump
MLPLILWFVGYIALMRWTIRRAGPGRKGLVRCPLGGHGPGGRQLYQHPFGQAFRPSRPRTRLYARGHRAARRPFAAEMRIVTKMDLTLTILNGLLILAVTGWAMWLWYHGRPRSAWSRRRRRWSCG